MDDNVCHACLARSPIFKDVLLSLISKGLVSPGSQSEPQSCGLGSSAWDVWLRKVT